MDYSKQIVLMGTLMFQAVEVLGGITFTKASDVYSYGICFYMLAIGAQRFCVVSQRAKVVETKERSIRGGSPTARFAWYSVVVYVHPTNARSRWIPFAA